MTWEEIYKKFGKLIDQLQEFAPKLVGAILVLIIGFWIIGKLEKMIANMMKKSGLDDDVRPFLQSIASIGLKVLLIFSCAGIVGIETTSFVAVLAAAGFAVGMALQGSLGNFAAGVMILVFKPFRAGDWIQVGDYLGKVSEIQMINTTITSLENKTVIIPNGVAISDVVVNLSTRKYLRVDINVSMPYEEDFPKVEQIIYDAIKDIPQIIEEPEPFVGIEEFESHSIKVAVRPYCLPDDYFTVYFEALKRIKAAMSANNIRVAYSEGIELGKIGK